MNDKTNGGKYFFFKARAKEARMDLGGTMPLYICDDYELLLLLIKKVISKIDRYHLGIPLSRKKTRLAKMVYDKLKEGN
jgi:hypothetical protein